MEIEVGETLFLDTNVLLTATDESRRNHRSARALIHRHRRGGFHLGLSGQILREYLVVATRGPKANGLGLESADAVKNVWEFRQRLLFFDETETVADTLRTLAGKHRLTGTRIHDANVIATMLTHGLSKLITDNQDDFKIFTEVQTAGVAEMYELVSGSA